ncbi:MAG: DUF2851 family protein [Bacteroidetes bacterium]|nr:DUF2851 family protein [Bacteroidota bacterium]
MKKLNLNESFISRIWMNPSNYGELRTTEGKVVEVLSYGKPNFDSGADFSDSIVKIDGVLYSGDIEIHCSVKDWKIHKHTKNRKYNKVILNVVMWGDESDDAMPKTARRTIPTVILSEFLSRSIHEIWKDLINNPAPAFLLPCSREIGNLDRATVKSWLNELGMERLKYRAERIKRRLETLKSETQSADGKFAWETALMEFVFEALGFSKNKEPFLKLAGMLDISKIRLCCKTHDDFDALLYGCSGLFTGHRDAYAYRIKSKWNLIQEELKSEAMDRSEWNFFRLRPVNFPTLRMAYASGFLMELAKGDLFRRLVFCFKNSPETVKDITGILLGIEYSDYWKTHYDFGKESKAEKTAAGQSRAEDIITNVVLPLMHVYSREFRDDDLLVKTKRIYMNGDDNSDNVILKMMKKQLGLRPSSICESQGVIHLHNFYCSKERCSECRIGEKVFERFSVSEAIPETIYS